MRRRRTQQPPLADVAHTNGKQSTFYPPPLPDGPDLDESPTRRQPLSTLATNSSFLFASTAPQPPVSPPPSLPPLSDELPLLEESSAGGPPTCPDCFLPLTVQEEDGALLLHCAHCHHARYMSTECLFPPTAAHSGLGPLLSGRPVMEDASEGGTLSRTVSNLFGTNGRTNSFIPMGDSLNPPSAAPSLASTLSFTAPTTLPLGPTSSISALSSPYPAMTMYDDSHSLSQSSFDGVSNRSMSNAFSAFSNNGSSFTSWSAVPHPSYLSDRDGAAVRHISSVSSHPVATTLQYEIDSNSGRPVSRLHMPSGGGLGNGYGDSELVMQVARERLSVDRHSLAVVPLASTTPYYRLPDALTAPHMPVLPYSIAPPTRRYHITTTSPQSSHRYPSATSTFASSSAISSPATATADTSLQDLTPAHYVAISELYIDELCNKLAQRGRLPSICRAALQHVMRQTECTFTILQHIWHKQRNSALDTAAAHTTKAKTSHAVALASAVFHYVYQRHVQQHNTRVATAVANPPPASSRMSPRSLVKLPQLEVSQLSGFIATSADSSNQHRITAGHLTLYIDAVTPHLTPLDLDAMSGPATATTVLLSRPLHVAACRPSFVEYADKFKLDTDTLVLAIDILNAAVRLNLSSRRNHGSLSAAALFLACCLQAVRLTQHDYCQQIGLTEVTLRKVNKELGLYWKELVPAGYVPKAVPQFLLKQVASAQKRQKEAEEGKVKEEATVVDENESSDGVSKFESETTVKKEPMDEAAAPAVQPTATSGVQLVYHEPFDVSVILPPLNTTTVVAPAVPHQVLTCRHRLSADSAARRSKAVIRTRSLLTTAVTSDSDTEEEGEMRERQLEEGGNDSSSSSGHSAADSSRPPAFLPPFVPVFHDVRS